MKRGHVYVIDRPNGPLHALVVSDDDVNEHIGGATVVQIFPARQETPTMLAITVSKPLPGTVVVDRFQTFAAKYFAAGQGPLGEADMEAVEVGLKTVLGL